MKRERLLFQFKEDGEFYNQSTEVFSQSVHRDANTPLGNGGLRPV
jgi:hypothetical protein